MASQVLTWGSEGITENRSAEVSQFASLGRRFSGGFRPIGSACMLERPVFVDGWWLVPMGEDSSAIPRRACRRVEAIYAAGLRPKGFILAHEAPPVLGDVSEAGEKTQATHPGLEQLTRGVRGQLSGALSKESLVGTVAPLVLKGLLGVLGAAATVIGFCGVLAVVALDPVLIAVTEDGHWVEVDRWMA